MPYRGCPTPGYPVILGQELTGRLMEQIAPFKPGFSLGERVDRLERQADDSWAVQTNGGTVILCNVIVIAGGLGSFEPRKPDVDGLSDFEGRGIQYMVKDPEQFRNRRIAIAGGGDSALDWTVF
jgi:thioredoxin reductase (NADPH)